jgi:hypothetical protein
MSHSKPIRKLPTGAKDENIREDLLYRVRSILRNLPDVMLFRDASALPPGSRYAPDISYPDIIGVRRAQCEHKCKILQPFAFMVQVPREKMNHVREQSLMRLRRYGWLTAIVSDPGEARAILCPEETP